MLVIYNQDGTIDLLATRECLEGNLSEADMEEELEPITQRSPGNHKQQAYEEVWK